MARGAYGMNSVIGASEIGHTIKACKGSALTLAVVGIDFLLRNDVPTILVRQQARSQRIGWLVTDTQS